MVLESNSGCGLHTGFIEHLGRIDNFDFSPLSKSPVDYACGVAMRLTAILRIALQVLDSVICSQYTGHTQNKNKFTF